MANLFVLAVQAGGMDDPQDGLDTVKLFETELTENQAIAAAYEAVQDFLAQPENAAYADAASFNWRKAVQVVPGECFARHGLQPYSGPVLSACVNGSEELSDEAYGEGMFAGVDRLDLDPEEWSKEAMEKAGDMRSFFQGTDSLPSTDNGS